MLISSLYTNSCSQFLKIKELVPQRKRIHVLYKACDLFSTMVFTKKNECIRQELGDYLFTEYAKLDFPFDWMAAQYAKDDTEKFARILAHLQSMQPVKVFHQTHYQLQGQDDVLDGKIHLVLRDKENVLHGIILHPTVCKRSMKGKSMDTHAEDDLHSLVGLYSLAEAYEGNIVLESIYLSQKADQRDKVAPFSVSNTAVTNCHILFYEKFKTDTVVDRDMVAARIEEVVAAVRQRFNCSACEYMTLCKIPNVSQSEVSFKSETQREYVIPTHFTESQLKAVRHNKGPMLVCAGPGSGKTAAIIGRIQYLVEECHIPPQFILVVTFTNKAVEELKKRCLSFLPEDRLPVIATLNGNSYSILRDNEDVLGMPVKVLTDSKELEIIKNISKVFPPIPGIKCDVVDGEYGLYRTLARRLNSYFSDSPDLFFYDHPEIGKEEFSQFASMYRDIIECGGYITFDQQITMANKLLEEHPDILRNYQRMYQYIMVDEFQDTNYNQARMLYMLAAKHKNILAVGDDDQSIYGFRGADLKYNMLGFKKMYPDCETVVFRENFRSTKALVSSSVSLINHNKERIEKDIISGRAVEGELPRLVTSTDVSVLEKAIHSIMAEGYSYKDVAIISATNKVLENLHDTLKCPTVLAKSYLIYDGLFLFALNILRLHKNRDDDAAFYSIAALFGKQNLLKNKKGESLYRTFIQNYGYPDVSATTAHFEEDDIFGKEMGHIADLFSIVDSFSDFSVFLDTCEFLLEWTESNSKEVMQETASLAGISTIDRFYDMLESMSEFLDEKRVEVTVDDRITLITSHDAKGKEYPVVFIYDTSKAMDEETRRVYYVTLTRGKDKCIVMRDVGCAADFMSEIPHTVWEVV